MLYMIVEHFRHGDALPVYRRFRDSGRMAPDSMISFAATHDLLATFIRPATVVAFAGEVCSVAATMGDVGWAKWRRLELGWRFWMGMGDQSAALAFACLVACLLLPIMRRSHGKVTLKNTKWCPWLNAATIVLVLFVPKIAVV